MPYMFPGAEGVSHVSLSGFPPGGHSARHVSPGLSRPLQPTCHSPQEHVLAWPGAAGRRISTTLQAPCSRGVHTGWLPWITMQRGKALQAERIHYLYCHERQYSRPLSACGSTLHVGRDQNPGFVCVVLTLYLDYKYLYCACYHPKKVYLPKILTMLTQGMAFGALSVYLVFDAYVHPYSKLVHGPPWWLCGKESTCQCKRPRLDPWVRKIPWRREWLPTPVFVPGNSHRQRSLAGYSPWGCQVWDTT